MKKNEHRDRERTVTIVIGPLTEAALTEIGERWQARMGSPMGDFTTVVGVALDREIQARQKLLELPVRSDSASHYD
jgi:hypothetical protein